MSLIKQNKPTKHMAPLCFQIYNREPKLCVVNQLTEYLKRTKSYRDRDKLLLTCIKPYRAASKHTISRWCKCIIKESCISIHSYTSHSSRAAASSYPKTRGASLCTTIHSAGWKRGHLANFTKNKSKKNLSFRIIYHRKTQLVKVDLYKKRL